MRVRFRIHVLAFQLWLLPLILFSGCKDPYQLVEVTGKVTTCEGAFPEGGRIFLQPLDLPDETKRPPGYPGPISMGQIEPDGTFYIRTAVQPARDGAVTGRHKVTFEMPLSERPSLNMDEVSEMTPVDYEEALQWLESIPVYPVIPCDSEIFPAEVLIVDGKNKFEFVLAPPKPQPSSEADGLGPTPAGTQTPDSEPHFSDPDRTRSGR